MPYSSGRNSGAAQVAHVWAQQSKPEKRAGNVFFEGETIYSYGRHFPIARFVSHKGRRAVLFTTQTYSVTTSGHLSYVHGALHGLEYPVFSVYDPAGTPQSEQVRTDYRQRVDTLTVKAGTARTRADSLMSSAQALANEANKCAEFFGFRWRLPVPSLTPELIAKCKAALAKDREANKKRAAERAAREAVQHAKDELQAAQWVAGADVSFPGYGYTDKATYLRLKGELVQTSRGAEVPAAHARRLWPIICRVIKSGVPYQRNGHTEHAGEFTVDSIAADGTLKAGCHTLAYSELAKIAAALGVA